MHALGEAELTGDPVHSTERVVGSVRSAAATRAALERAKPPANHTRSGRILELCDSFLLGRVVPQQEVALPGVETLQLHAGAATSIYRMAREAVQLAIEDAALPEVGVTEVDLERAFQTLSPGPVPVD